MNDVRNIKAVNVGILGGKLSMTVTYSENGTEGEEEKFFTVRMTKEEALKASQDLQQLASQIPE